MALTAAEAIDTTNEVFGSHPGFRALHAKGIVATAVFRPAPEAAALSRAAHLQGPDVPATVRFSNGSGDPRHLDYAPDPRRVTDGIQCSADPVLNFRPRAYSESIARLTTQDAP